MTTINDRTAPHELLVKARALAPSLAQRAAETGQLRRIPDETIAAFQEAGLFRMLQPARWGGAEVDPRVFFDVQMTIAAACPSSAWVLGVVAVHNWQLALFAEAAQEEVWGTDPCTLISSSYATTGKVVRADGGYRISGRWSFSSGCDHCQWVFLGGFVPPEGESKTPDMRTFLLPRSDYRIDDNWHVAGLKGTGSKDIVVEDAFVWPVLAESGPLVQADRAWTSGYDGSGTVISTKPVPSAPRIGTKFSLKTFVSPSASLNTLAPARNSSALGATIAGTLFAAG